MRLFDGAIGPTQLSQAQATASLDAAQRLKFGMDLEPAEPRTGGFARVTGSVPLRSPAHPTAGGNALEKACSRLELPGHDGGATFSRAEAVLIRRRPDRRSWGGGG